MNKRGVHEHHGILVMLALGLLAVGLLLYSTGTVDLSSLSSGTAGLTGFAGFETTEEPLSAAPAPNQPPTYTGSSFSTPVDTPLSIDLAPLFSDPEGDALTFLATSEDQVSVDVTDSTATFTPAQGFSGERTITIAVSDGTNLMREPVRLTVGAASAPASEQQQASEPEAPPAPETPPPEPPAELSFSTQDVITNCAPGPVLMNTSTTLTNNISSNTTCITLSADNVTLDCAGFTIFYDANGTDATGVSATGRTNITIRNCVIHDLNATGGSSGQGILLSAVNNSLVINNTLIINTTEQDSGISMSVSRNNTIANNTITIQGIVSSNHGIFISSNNVGNTITGNTISTTGTSGNTGITMSSRSNNNTITNNSITTNGSSTFNVGINSVNNSGNTIAQNRIATNGTDSNHGVLLQSSSSDNLVENNSITTNGSSSNNYGVYIFTVANNNNVTGNTITTTAATSNNYGVYVESSSNNLIASNRIFGGGSVAPAVQLFDADYQTVTNNVILVYAGSSSYGIYVSSTADFNNLTRNNITTLGASDNTGIRVSGAQNNTLSFNNIVTNGTSSHGIESGLNALYTSGNDNNITTNGSGAYGISITGSNYTSLTNTILSDPTLWITTAANTFFTNFTNTTFSMPNGSIAIGGLAQINGTADVTKAKLNVTFNRAFLNASNLTFLNQTGIVALAGLSMVDPSPRVDFEDDGTFSPCTSTADPFCTEISYTGGVFTFNTSHFTTFNATDAAVVTDCAIINTSSILTQNVTNAGNCFTIGANNVDFNCNGFNITYGTGGSGEVFGINISNRNNVTVRNCGIFKGSALGARAYGIAYLNSSNSTLFNNTIRTNGTEENDAIHTGIPGSVNVTFTPTSTAIVTNDGNVNNPFCTNATGVSLCQVCFDTGGVNCAFLGQSGCVDGEGYKFDDILRFNLSNNTNVSSGNIQVIGGEAVFCNLNANTTISFGTRNNCGSFRSATFSGEFFVAGENNLTCAVAGGGKDEDNGFKLVSFSYEGTTLNVGLTVTGNSTTLNATGNTILADGGPNTRGIYLDAPGSILAFNTVVTAGANESHGILLGGENTTVLFNNVTTADGGKSRGVVTVSRFSNITDNIIRIIGSSDEREGILILGNNTRIAFNNITTLSGRLSHGIHLLGAFFANVTGNNLSVGAGNGSHGIFLSAANTTIADNNVSVNTSSLSHGISLTGSVATGNTITGNSIRANSRGSNALNLVTVTGNTLSNNNIILANQSSAYLDRSLGNTFASSTLPVFGSSLFILQENGSINYTQALTLSTSTLLSQVVSIGHNRTFVNATHPGGSQLNASAMLRFFSLPGDGVIPVFDDADDGTFDLCPGGRCRNTTYNQSTGILQYNVTHFTTYAAQEVSACATIDNIENATTLNVTLTNNVTGTVDCFTVVAENVTFTCAGFPIFFDSSGTGGDGIIVEHTTNVVVRDCILIDITSTGQGGIGINITNSSNVRILNTSIQTNGTNNSYGVNVNTLSNNTHANFSFVNLTINTRGITNFASNNSGFHIIGGNLSNITIENSTISTNGTSDNDGIRIGNAFTNSRIRDVRIVRNNILTNGTFRNNGMFFGVSSALGVFLDNLYIANNTITTLGTSTINNGIYLFGTFGNATIEQNNITVNSSSSSSNAISLDTFNSASFIENITIRNNTARIASGSSSPAMAVENFAGGMVRNISYIYNTVTTNGSSSNDGFEMSGVRATLLENNTIVTSGTSSSNNGIEISTSYANVTIYNNLINTSGTSFNNGITLSGGFTPTNITIINNNISTGSRPGGTIVGNTNRGISLSSITGSLLRDNFITTNGTSNNTGIFVGPDSSFNTIANNTITSGGNESDNHGIALFISPADFGSIASHNVTNNTVNSTGFGRSSSSTPVGFTPSRNIGILLHSNGNSGTVNNNIVRINTVHARGNDSDNYGIALIGSVQYNNVTNNQVVSNGTDRNYGIHVGGLGTSFQAIDNIVEWNNVTAWGIASTDNHGIFLHSFAIRQNVTNNNFTTRGSDRNHGVFINASSNHNRVEFNNFTLRTTGTDNIGAIISASNNNTLRNNFFQMNTSALDGGLQLLSAANGNNISNNTFITNGTILKVSSSTLNLIQDQNLSTQPSEAIIMASASFNNFTNVIVTSDQNLALLILPGAGNGSYYDGFEDGTISPFTTAGNHVWIINNTHVNSGSFSAQAADINDSQAAAIILQIETTGPGRISFARRVESESGFDFLRFSINGVEQTTFSGILNYSTFNFTFTGTGNTVFVWNYTKDGSVATANDTAWIDDINITFEGNGSKNNSFTRSFLFTNNTWIFVGENNTNNTLENTTFTGQNGTINILPLVHVTPNSNATIGRLNNTHNLSFLNSAALGYLNTTAILRFLQILFIDPAPFRDLEDDGTFAYCPPSRCAELALIDNQFIYNTSGFSFYASAEGQVNLSINKTDSQDPIPVSSQLNYTIRVNNSGSSTAFNLTLLEIYPPEVIFLTAQPTPSSGNNTFFLGNLTPESQIVLNITVFVRNVTADIFINNTVNATFLNQSNATIRANVTESTQVTNPAVLNMSTVSISKTDSPDPVNASGTLTYVINVTGTGPGIARNVSVNDTYPPQVIFISAQPTPITGTNNTFFLGNITNGTSVLINITMIVLNISNNTIINNSANVTFQNNTNFTFTAVATASTTVLNDTANVTPPTPAPAAGGGSGGGWTTPTVGGVQLEQPAQAPPGPCIENWACDDWSACSLGRQSRACYDQNQCNTTQYVPVQARTCMDLAPPAPEEEPLALPDIKVEQDVPAIETPRWSICAVMPLIVDGALLVLAVLVLLYLILTARQRAEKYWRTILDVAAGIILALLIIQYVTCKEFLPLQYGVFILLALFVLLMRLADHLKARNFAPYTPPLRPAESRSAEPQPEAEPDRAELPPLRITNPAKTPANLKALTAAVKRNEKTMQEFLKVLKKK